jgi:hypothetical protein
VAVRRRPRVRPAHHARRDGEAWLAVSSGARLIAADGRRVDGGGPTRRPLVLVPGACLGGWAWREVATSLRANGQEVYPVTLTGLGERVHLADRKTDLDTRYRRRGEPARLRGARASRPRRAQLRRDHDHGRGGPAARAAAHARVPRHVSAAGRHGDRRRAVPGAARAAAARGRAARRRLALAGSRPPGAGNRHVRKRRRVDRLALRPDREAGHRRSRTRPSPRRCGSRARRRRTFGGRRSSAPKAASTSRWCAS